MTPPPEGNGTVRVRLATMMAWTLLLTVAAIAGLGYLAMNARETFTNWGLIEKILVVLDHAVTALAAGLLGYMARDAKH